MTPRIITVDERTYAYEDGVLREPIATYRVDYDDVYPITPRHHPSRLDVARLILVVVLLVVFVGWLVALAQRVTW
jgi:hypothetical protein